MAKKKASDTVADRIAEFIGTAMGDLTNRRDALMRQLQEVEAQIGDVRERVAKQFGGPSSVRGARKSARKAAKKARVISAKTRAKMAAAAKKRWAKAKKAGKNRLA